MFIRVRSKENSVVFIRDSTKNHASEKRRRRQNPCMTKDTHTERIPLRTDRSRDGGVLGAFKRNDQDARQE